MNSENNTLTLSPEQLSAVMGIVDCSVHFLRGSAGSGKTCVIKSAVEFLNGQAQVYAPTHIAAGILRYKGVENVYQTSSLKNKSHWLQIGSKKITHLILDEAGMVDKFDIEAIMAHARACKTHHVHVILAGDWKQLPPVTADYADGSGDWYRHAGTDDNTVTLSTDFRADDNIIRKVSPTLNDPMSFDKIIVASNIRRQELNIAMHKEKHGYRYMARFSNKGMDDVMMLHRGDKLVSKFNGGRKFQNNEIYTVSKVEWDRTHYRIWFEGKRESVLIDKKHLSISHLTSSAAKTEEKKQARKFVEGGDTKSENHFELAYAVTCHSAQGAEWDRVAVIIDDTLDYFEPLAKNWFYTAITRARKEVVVVDASGQMAKRGFSFDADEMFGLSSPDTPAAPVAEEAAPACEGAAIEPVPTFVVEPVVEPEMPAVETPEQIVQRRKQYVADLLARRAADAPAKVNVIPVTRRPDVQTAPIQPTPELFTLIDLIKEE